MVQKVNKKKVKAVSINAKQEDADIELKPRKRSADKEVISPKKDASMEGQIPKKKKQKQTPESESETTPLKKVEIPTESYTVGMLSNIFGKETTDTASVDVYEGESTISVKTKAEPLEPKRDRKVQRANRHIKKEKKQEEKEKVANEDQRTVYIGNMPISANERLVRKLFTPFGKIESIRMRGVIPSKETVSKHVSARTQTYHWNQKSLIFYVKFAEEESVNKALALNGTAVEDHKICVDRVGTKKDYDKNTTIFVGNLPFTVHEDAITKLFEEQVGPVVFTRCVKDNATGMGKGFGFVNFKDSSSVDIALEMSGLEFDGKPLRITKLMKKQQIHKTQVAIKKNMKKTKEENKQPSKIDNFKFSTKEKKIRTAEQVEKRKLKKTAKKAIMRKKQSKQGKSMMT